MPPKTQALLYKGRTCHKKLPTIERWSPSAWTPMSPSLNVIGRMLTKLEATSSASDRIEEQEVANIPSKNGFQPQERVPLFDLRK